MPLQPKKRGPKPKLGITPPQRRTLLEIDRYCRRHQFAPTIQELADSLEISPASVHEQINQLVRKGYLKRSGGKTRGLVVLRKPQDHPSRLVPIPLVGTVAAGWPSWSEEDVLGEVLVEQDLAARDRCFALAVRGESMRSAGIGDGDVVIIRQQPLAECGDIVVALVDGEATVKRLFLQDHTIELQPESPLKKYRPIPIGPETDFRIVGKVVAVRGRLATN
ncbi:MAG: repressor LexA [Planctomycetes bacterium]|nr:repressor LexA [Planctomycetota bacterium]